jgi:hypothetical protein
MCLPHVPTIFKKLSPKTFGLHCVWWKKPIKSMSSDVIHHCQNPIE